MKPSFLFLAVFLCSATAGAQQLRRCEGEIGAVVPVAAKRYGGKFEPAWNVYAEGRRNFAAVPLDLGIRLQYGAFYRSWASTHVDRNYRAGTLMAVADYTFRRLSRVAFFAGCGAGISLVQVEHAGPASKSYRLEAAACLEPRVGIDFFHHLRLTVGYRLLNREYSTLEVGVGIVVGGGPKR